jgi:hypothetical protein
MEWFLAIYMIGGGVSLQPSSTEANCYRMMQQYRQWAQTAPLRRISKHHSAACIRIDPVWRNKRTDSNAHG